MTRSTTTRFRELRSVRRWRLVRQSLSLSAREFDIVQLILDGRSELQVGEALKISPNTVHTHVQRLYRKLGVNSRVGLVKRLMVEYMSVSPRKGTTRDASSGDRTRDPPPH